MAVLSEREEKNKMFKKDKNDYSEDAILRERTFPKKNTAIIVFIVMIQIALIAFGIL